METAGIPLQALHPVVEALQSKTTSLQQQIENLSQIQSHVTWRDIINCTVDLPTFAVTSSDTCAIESDHDSFKFNVNVAIQQLNNIITSSGYSNTFTCQEDILCSWDLVQVSFDENNRKDMDLFLYYSHMLTGVLTHVSEWKTTPLYWYDVYSNQNFNKALNSMPPITQAQHYLKMSQVCSPLVMCASHAWGNPPPSLVFLARAFEIASSVSSSSVLQQVVCHMCVACETLDYQSKVCWIEDSNCEDPSFLLAVLRQLHTLAYFTPNDLRQHFCLPKRLFSYIKTCVSFIKGPEKDEFALCVLKELWGIHTNIVRDIGIFKMCIDMGSMGVTGKAKTSIAGIRIKGIPDVTPPAFPKHHWLVRQLEITNIRATLLSEFLAEKDSSAQIHFSQSIRKWLENDIHNIACALGRCEDEYEVIGFGSLAKETMSPYSDVDIGVLVSSVEMRNSFYWKALIRGISFCLHSVCDKVEWDGKDLICKGLKVDNDCVLSISKCGESEGSAALGTAETWLTDVSNVGMFAATFLHTVKIFGSRPSSHLLETFRNGLTQLLSEDKQGELLRKIQSAHAPKKSLLHSIKGVVLSPLTFAMQFNALYSVRNNQTLLFEVLSRYVFQNVDILADYINPEFLAHICELHTVAHNWRTCLQFFHSKEIDTDTDDSTVKDMCNMPGSWSFEELSAFLQVMGDTSLKALLGPLCSDITDHVCAVWRNLDVSALNFQKHLHYFEHIGSKIPPLPPHRASEAHLSWRSEGLLLQALTGGCSVNVVRILLNLGHNIMSVDASTKQNVMHKAAESKRGTLVIQALANASQHKQQLLDAKDRNGNTPLDVAMLHFSFHSVQALICEGAYLCDTERALNFYCSYVRTADCEEGMKSAFKKLLCVNTEVAWRVGLEEVLPPSSSSGKTGGDVFVSPVYGNRTLLSEVKAQLMGANGEFVSCGKAASHIVAYAKVEGALQQHGLYFKVHPGLPGMEQATALFTRNLLGFGAPHSELMRFKGVLVLVSQEVVGESMVKAMTPEHSHLLQQLDDEETAGLIIVAMLTNPEDGKPDNYIVTPHPLLTGKYRLVCIDNDQAFVPAFVRVPYSGVERSVKGVIRNVAVAQVKTVLFCLDQMKLAVPPTLREKLQNTDVCSFLSVWLQSLKQVSDSQHSLLSEKRAYLQTHHSFIGVGFRKGEIHHIYEKWVRLTALLREDPKLTLTQLLSKLEPRLAKRYANEFAVNGITVASRFRNADKPYYHTRKGGSECSYTTLTMSGDILQSANITQKEFINPCIIDEAITELHRINKELMILPNLSELLREKKQLDSYWLTKLSLEESRAVFLKHISTTREFVEPKLQKQILKYLVQQQNVRSMQVPNFTILSNSFLQKLPLVQLTSVDLRSCVFINNASVMLLAAEAPALVDLNLGSLPLLSSISKVRLARAEKQINFPSLQNLNLAGCGRLSKILIYSLNLKWINVVGCNKLTVSKDDLLRQCKCKLIENRWFGVKTQQSINKMLRSEIRKPYEAVKILLSGTLGAGKSTFAKQMKICHLRGFDDEERQLYKSIIFNNIMVAIRVLITAVKDMRLEVLEANQEAVKWIESQEEDYFKGTLSKIVHDIKDIWNDPAIQLAYSRQSEFQLSCSTKYYLDRIEQIGADGYVPNDQNILCSRAKTTGIIETDFDVGGLHIKVVDVGGARSCRKKWLHCFQDVTVMVFFVALSEYDLKLSEDGETNRMHESLMLFEWMCNLTWLRDTAVVLLLNSRDLFEEKIKRVPLTVCFPEYDGPMDTDSTIAFIQSKFEAQKEDPKKTLYTFVTSAVDTADVTRVFNELVNTVIRRA